MYETDAEVEALQALLDRSYARAGGHLRSIITPQRRLSARQIVAYLQGVKHIAVATVTAGGEPRVSPVDSLFLHARFYFGTAQNALRLQHLRRNPAVSVSHFLGEDLAITAHGRAVIIDRDRDHAEAALIERDWLAVYGFSPWEPAKWLENNLSPEVAFVRVEPATLISFAQEPARLPETSGA